MIYDDGNDDDDKDLFDHLMEGVPVALLARCQEHLLSIHFHTQEDFSLSPSMKYHKYHKYHTYYKLDKTTFIFV